MAMATMVQNQQIMTTVVQNQQITTTVVQNKQIMTTVVQNQKMATMVENTMAQKTMAPVVFNPKTMITAARSSKTKAIAARSSKTKAIAARSLKTKAVVVRTPKTKAAVVRTPKTSMLRTKYLSMVQKLQPQLGTDQTDYEKLIKISLNLSCLVDKYKNNLRRSLEFYRKLIISFYAVCKYIYKLKDDNKFVNDPKISSVFMYQYSWYVYRFAEYNEELDYAIKKFNLPKKIHIAINDVDEDLSTIVDVYRHLFIKIGTLLYHAQFYLVTDCTRTLLSLREITKQAVMLKVHNESIELVDLSDSEDESNSDSDFEDESNKIPQNDYIDMDIDDSDSDYSDSEYYFNVNVKMS